ncbi:hypothetical protein B6N13_14375 [Marinomonas sp. UCMA 3892]|uniref:hypothetical protein n=1 Tax=Marinomonas sp. UCMA 3892 TaxID=1972585 RepID=UPI00146C2367|nr:hypothetical protein [Marinomonas sp. UCMA 3892]NLU99264.1 hypothetical protein [Marinomonas sp. UCMA 3892]
MKNKQIVKGRDVYKVVGDGAIATQNAADGRIIPLVILDGSSNQSLDDLIAMHVETPPGDVKSSWCYKRFSKKYIYLTLRFITPMDITVSIVFSVYDNMLLIDGIIKSRGIYIQSGKAGDKISHDVNAPKILVEIPSSTTFPPWEKIFRKNIRKHFLWKGVEKNMLNEATDNYIKESRVVWARRI